MKEKRHGKNWRICATEYTYNMVKRISNDWKRFMFTQCEVLLSSQRVAFDNLMPRHIPEVPGVYLITVTKNSIETPYYVGRTKNLRRRIYGNHLMGSPQNARLKNYLIKDRALTNVRTRVDAKVFIRRNCMVRWIAEEAYSKNLPDKTRHLYQVRGLLESFMTSELFPRYGIYEEH